MQTKIYLIAGRVQGVGFRYFVRDQARRIGVVGHVKNLPDGRVECVATGDVEMLQNLEQRLRQGPPGSQVDSVNIEERAAAVPAGSFEITF